jgi:hypothetical protein
VAVAAGEISAEAGKGIGDAAWRAAAFNSTMARLPSKFCSSREPYLSCQSEEFPLKKQVPHDKYFLRSLHQEIDLYDRKLDYLDKYAQFASMADREGAESKLLAKRASLAQTAKQLVADGVEFSPADLPRSFRTSESAVADH